MAGYWQNSFLHFNIPKFCFPTKYILVLLFLAYSGVNVLGKVLSCLFNTYVSRLDGQRNVTKTGNEQWVIGNVEWGMGNEEYK